MYRSTTTPVTRCHRHAGFAGSRSRSPTPVPWSWGGTCGSARAPSSSRVSRSETTPSWRRDRSSPSPCRRARSSPETRRGSSKRWRIRSDRRGAAPQTAHESAQTGPTGGRQQTELADRTGSEFVTDLRHRTGRVALLVTLIPAQEVVDRHVLLDGASNAVREQQLANVKLPERQIPAGLVVARGVPPMKHENCGDHAFAEVQLVQPQPARFVRGVTKETHKALHRRLIQSAGQPPALPQCGVQPRQVGNHVVERPHVVVRAEAHRLTLVVQAAVQATELLAPVRAETLFVL